MNEYCRPDAFRLPAARAAVDSSLSRSSFPPAASELERELSGVADDLFLLTLTTTLLVSGALTTLLLFSKKAAPVGRKSCCGKLIPTR